MATLLGSACAGRTASTPFVKKGGAGFVDVGGGQSAPTPIAQAEFDRATREAVAKRAAERPAPLPSIEGRDVPLRDALAALRAARRLGEMAGRFERDVRPILANLQKVSEEAARASAQAAAQIDRLDALVAGVARRVEETAAAVQETILQPARDGLALLSGLKSIIASFREPRQAREPRDGREGRDKTPAAPDDELFIG